MKFTVEEDGVVMSLEFDLNKHYFKISATGNQSVGIIMPQEKFEVVLKWLNTKSPFLLPQIIEVMLRYRQSKHTSLMQKLFEL